MNESSSLQTLSDSIPSPSYPHKFIAPSVETQASNMQLHTTHFQTRKFNCLSKRDKSSAGRIDPRAVDICAALNSRDEYYTTSSCAGRCFLYCGDGIKSWHSTAAAGDDINDSATIDGGGSATGVIDDTVAGKLGFFKRYRVNHDIIREPTRYFDLTTLIDGQDPTGGGDPIPTIGQFDHGNNAGFKSKLDEYKFDASTPLWLRFEPFILHVMCRSLKAASVLMALARPAFKNVGLTSWNSGGGGGDEENATDDGKNKNQQTKGGGPRYLVAIWGDEGLDMPLSLPSSPGQGLYYNPNNDQEANAEWLTQLVNERHARNWKKIDRFVEAMKGMAEGAVDVVARGINGLDDATHGIDKVELSDEYYNDSVGSGSGSSKRAQSGLPLPRSYDVVGDVAVLNSLPEGDEETQRKVGEWILSRNKAMKVCCKSIVCLRT